MTNGSTTSGPAPNGPRINGPMALVPAFVACLVIFTGVASMQERGSGAAGPAAEALARGSVTAGGYIYLSGLTSPGEDSPTAQLDVKAQTAAVLDAMKAELERAGSSMAQVVSVYVYLAKSADFDAMNGVYKERFTDAPPARATVQAELPRRVAVMMSAVAVPNGVRRDVMLPATWMKSPRPYSYIVRAGDLVFLSGLLSRRGIDDKVVPGSVSVQVRTILDNAGTLLKTAGLSYKDVVAARVYLTDDSAFQAMNDAYRTYFPDDPPARATAVTPLMSNEAGVEISLIASTVGKQVIGPTVAPSLPVSTAIRVGPRVFLSGVVGNTETNTTDLNAQTREVFTRVQRSLELAGMTYADVVDNTTYLTDIYQQKVIDKMYPEFVTPPGPARTVFGARMAARASLVEMIMTAVK